MKSVMRITALVAFCLVHSPSAVPQQKTTAKEKKTEQVQIFGARHGTQTSTGVWLGRRYYDKNPIGSAPLVLRGCKS